MRGMSRGSNRCWGASSNSAPRGLSEVTGEDLAEEMEDVYGTNVRVLLCLPNSRQGDHPGGSQAGMVLGLHGVLVGPPF